jgi:hypothetical protein
MVLTAYNLTCHQGQWRKVIVDDRVPFDSSDRMLLPVSSMAGELWPALVAKAVLKLGRHFLTRMTMLADGPRGSGATVPPTPALLASASAEDGSLTAQGRPGSSLPTIAGTPSRAPGVAHSNSPAAPSVPISPAVGPASSPDAAPPAVQGTAPPSGGKNSASPTALPSMLNMLTGWLPETQTFAAGCVHCGLRVCVRSCARS